MINAQILQEKEPRLYKLFLNSRKYNRLANAYLLYGDRNSPLKETAIYLAKSLSCENSTFACDTCPSCLRFNQGIRPDFIMIDGSKGTIKKDDILMLEKKFSTSALEKGHVLAYVINYIENITEEAANSLLKFLEEPKQNQVAFLTTTNINKVLPTIQSRSTSIRIDPIDENKLYSQLCEIEVKIGKKTKLLPLGACYILSKLSSSVEEAKDIVENDEAFLSGYQAAEEFVNELAMSTRQGSYNLLYQTTQIKGSACYNWLFLILSVIFTQCLEGDINSSNPFYDAISTLSKKRGSIAKAEEIIKEAIALKQINLSPTLTCSRIIMALKEAN